MPEGLAGKARHRHGSCDSIRTNEKQTLLPQQKEGDGKGGGEHIFGGEEDDDYNDDDYFLDLDVCQVCRKVNNARRRLDKSINLVPGVDFPATNRVTKPLSALFNQQLSND